MAENMRLPKSNRILLAILTGCLLGLSFPYTGSLTPLVFIAWVPLLLVEHHVLEKRYRASQIALYAWIAFFLYNFIATWWIQFASVGGAVMAIVANSICMTIPFYFFHLTRRYVGKREGNWAFIIFWLGFEYLHYHWELSWPWLNLGNVFSLTPSWVQWYSITGVLGGTLWILIVNLLFKNVLLTYWKNQNFRSLARKMIAPTFLLTAPILASFWLKNSANTTQKTGEISVGIIQPNVDPYNEKFVLNLDVQVNKLLQQAKEMKSADLIIAPETALAYEFYEEDAAQYNFFKQLVDSVKVWNNTLLIGASTRRHFESARSAASRKYSDGPGFFESYNTSLQIDSDGAYHFIHKSKLVLGVEKVPFMGSLPFLDELALNLDGASGTLGIEDRPKLFENGKKLRYAPVVCYESVYGSFVAEQIAQNAAFIAIITNDGWWKDTPGYKQHWSFARLRAIENGRWVVRSANTGWSGVINHFGEDVQRSSWWKKETMYAAIETRSGLTVYSRRGDIIGRVAGFTSVFLFLFMAVRRFRFKQEPRAKKSV